MICRYLYNFMDLSSNFNVLVAACISFKALIIFSIISYSALTLLTDRRIVFLLVNSPHNWAFTKSLSWFVDLVSLPFAVSFFRGECFLQSPYCCQIWLVKTRYFHSRSGSIRTNCFHMRRKSRFRNNSKNNWLYLFKINKKVHTYIVLCSSWTAVCSADLYLTGRKHKFEITSNLIESVVLPKCCRFKCWFLFALWWCFMNDFVTILAALLLKIPHVFL